ncbi:hypothetical protein FOC84_14930 [Achromobacter pestifer]|uniref:Uncharacterized protein n=1 Tax=Achromobacter pestifer TaxID=1353889 RepID=A0A7D4DXW0_9BURK|nr:hypothetical protein [Achromobacter pestifer]QKH36172.1 hypothetical protein FOC84_14930 [Achromobacter pestifer]
MFLLSSGMTVLACKKSGALSDCFGMRAIIYVAAKERQKIEKVREHILINRSKNENILALETDDFVRLTQEEVRSGTVCIVFEN